MNELNELAAAVKSLVPGTIGAVSAVVYTRGDWVKRTINVFMSAAAAYYSYEYLSELIGFPSGLVSFFIGLTFAPVFDKFIDEINETPLGSIFKRFIGVKK